MPKQTKSGPVDIMASHLVSNMDWSVGTCGETSPRLLHEGNAIIKEHNIMPKMIKDSFRQ